MTEIWSPFSEYTDIRFEALHDDCEGLRIILSGKIGRISNRQPLRILFLTSEFYKNTDESWLISDRLGLDDDGNFKMANRSGLIDLVNASSANAMQEGVKHYSIYTEDECVDILSYSQPVCEALYEKKP